MCPRGIVDSTGEVGLPEGKSHTREGGERTRRRHADAALATGNGCGRRGRSREGGTRSPPRELLAGRPKIFAAQRRVTPTPNWKSVTLTPSARVLPAVFRLVNEDATRFT
jgi:hypothetical protein